MLKMKMQLLLFLLFSLHSLLAAPQQGNLDADADADADADIKV